jgi:predicted nucleotidyltransferase component of viral defense system
MCGADVGDEEAEMNRAIQDMLARYDCASAGDYEHALREIFQELALLGLWRGKFFEHAAFYGGTALRIVHGMDRFSEDLDFSLLTPNASFDFKPYCGFVEKELAAWGFPVTVEVKQKRAESAIESAFLKAETLQQMLLIEVPESVVGGLHRTQLLRIKVEVDTRPPLDFLTEMKFLLEPIPFSVRLYTLPSLFAGKMHALLFRRWGCRVKGRDWYDFVWYTAKRVPLDLKHLSARMRQTGHWDDEEDLPEETFRRLLMERIQSLDVRAARADVEPFLKDSSRVAVWSTVFFEQLAERVVMLEA